MQQEIAFRQTNRSYMQVGGCANWRPSPASTAGTAESHPANLRQSQN